MIRSLRLLFLVWPPVGQTSRGLEFAGELAVALKAPLHIALFSEMHGLSLLDVPSGDCTDFGHEDRPQPLRQYLDQQAALLRARGVEVFPELVSARVSAAESAACAQRVKADIIIKDLGVGSGNAPNLSPMDWELLSASPVSVMYIRPDTTHPVISRMLAAVDLELPVGTRDNGNHAIIGLAQYLANALDASLDIVSIYDGAAGSRHTSSSQYEVRQRAFNALAGQHDISAEHRHFLPGAPANTLHAYMQRAPYDLLVIGAANHHVQPRAIGATAEDLLGNPYCSIFAIKLPCNAVVAINEKNESSAEIQLRPPSNITMANS